MGSSPGALKSIESVLYQGSKASTYKFALLRGLVDAVGQNPTHTGDLRVPMTWLAMRALDYYWPLLGHREPIAQSGIPLELGRQHCFGIYRDIHEYRGAIMEELGKDGDFAGLSQQAESKWFWHDLHRLMDLYDRTFPAVTDLVVRVRNRLINQPVRYLPVNKEQGTDLFLAEFKGVVLEDPQALRDACAKHGVKRKEPQLRKARTHDELLTGDDMALVIPRRQVSSIREIRACILASIEAKWALACMSWEPNKGHTEHILDEVSTILPPGRHHEERLYRRLISEAYVDHGRPMTCVYTGKRLERSWAMDHVLPWSRYTINATWNLVPADSKVNGQKSDKLLVWTDDFESRFGEHLDVLDAFAHPFVRRDRERAARSLGKASMTVDAMVGHVRDMVHELHQNSGLPTWDVGG